MGIYEPSLSIEINAPRKLCYQIICDFKNYTRWTGYLKQVNILKTENNRAKIVEFIVNLGIIPKDFRYVLNYTYDDEDFVLSWTYVEGSLRDVKGSYSFKSKTDEITIATYKLIVDPGFWVPEIIKNKIINVAMRGSMIDFKKEVESHLKQKIQHPSHLDVSP